MKKLDCFLGLAVLVLSAATTTTTQAANNGLEFGEHPRLFYTVERVGRLRERVKGDGALKEAWGEQVALADRLLETELVSREYAEGGKGQHGNYGRPSGQIHQMASTLGLAYRVTGDERYARKLKETLLHFGTFSRWAGDAHHDPPWHSELNTARFCYGYGVGYDSIRNYLTKSERKTIAEAMVRLGILPTLNDWVLGEKRIHALDSMGHNWWSVCVSMAGVASLSLLGDEPRAEYWVRKVSDAFDEWFYYSGNVLQNKTGNFDADGAFYESVSYANYALSEYLLFRLAYTNALPDSAARRIPLLDTAGDFFVHTCYPTSDSMLAVNFGDSSIQARGGWTLWLLGVNGFDRPEYRWYADRTKAARKSPLWLLYGDSRGGALPADLGCSKLYSDIGWAMLRSSWDDDATMLAIKSGYAWNHAHPDAGSFILFHGGKPLIIDSGNCSYSRREYSSYYRRSKAHNVILADGEAELGESCGNGDRGTVTEGKIHRLMDGAGLKYVFADATGPTGWKFSRNYRHFLWVGDVILIFDDVRTHEAAKLEWLLHYAEKAEVKGGDIHIANGKARAIVRPLWPRGMNIAERTGLKDHDPDTEVGYLALCPDKETREAKFITAILPVYEDRKAPRLELLEQKEAVGVRVMDGETTTDVWLNLRADGRKMHRNSCHTIAGWETDAYMFGVTRKSGADADDCDGVSRYFVACGSYLRRDGKVVLDSLSKLYAVFATEGSEMEVQVEGQPVINAALRATEKPRTVKLNGSHANIEYDEMRESVIIRLDQR